MASQTIIEFQDNCCRVYHWENARNTYTLKLNLPISFKTPEPAAAAADGDAGQKPLSPTPTPPGAGADSSADSKTAERNGELLRQALKESGLKIKEALALVPKHWVTLRVVTLPATDPEELAEMARFEAERHIPFNVDRHIISHHIVSIEEIQGARVILAALDAPPARQITATCNIAGIRLTGVEVTTVALVNSLLHTHSWDHGSDHTVAHVNIGQHNTDIIILHNGEPIFARSAALGVDKIQDAIQGTINSLKTPTEDEAVFHIDDAAPAPDSPPAPDAPPAAPAPGLPIANGDSKILRSIRLVREIRRTLDYAHRECECEELSRIFLSGAGAQIVNLERVLRASFNVPLEILDPFRKPASPDSAVQLQCDTSVAGMDQPPSAYAMAAGALIRAVDEKSLAINLIPPDYVKARSQTKRKKALLYGGLAALVAMVCSFVATAQILAFKESDLEELRLKIKANAILAKEIKDQQTVVKIFATNRQQISALEIIDAISQWKDLFQEKNMRVCIIDFHYSTRYKRVTIVGYAKTYDDLNDFEARLKNTDLFETVAEESRGITTPYRVPVEVVSFTVNGYLKTKKTSRSR